MRPLGMWGGARHPFLGAALAAAVGVACGGGGDVADDVAALDPAPAPMVPAAPAEPASREPPIESGYVLARVDGQSLPALVGERAGCELYLRSGMVILEDARFELRHTTEERCAGRAPREATHRARGDATRDGDTVHLTATEGTAFTTATGTYRDATLRLHTLETESGDRAVDWAYDRR